MKLNLVVRFFVLIFLSILLLNDQSFSQERTLPLRQLSFKDGLSNETVKCVVKDKDGFLWIGTQNGLNRHDGYVAKIINPMKDGKPLLDREINTIVEDQSGDLWIGTTLGLYRYNRKTCSIEEYAFSDKQSNTLSNNNITYLFVDDDKELWIGTQNGLDKYDKNTNSIIRYYFNPENNPEIRNNDINCIIDDKAGNLWIASWHGWLSSFNKKSGKFTYYKYPRNFKNVSDITTITKIHIDHNGQFWICYQNRISATFNRSSGTFSENIDDLKKLPNYGDQILWSTFDSEGHVWYFDGINFHIFDNESKTYKSFHAGTENARIDFKSAPNSILNDNDEVFWLINSVYQGFEYEMYADKFTSHYSNLPKTPATVQNYLRAFAIDKNGNSYYGTFGDGLFLKRAGSNTYQQYSFKSPLDQKANGNYITTLAIDKNERIWIGSFDGIRIMNTETRQIEKVLKSTPDTENSLNDNIIEQIFFDSHENAWIVCSESLDLYEPKENRFTHFSSKNLQGLTHFDVYDIIEDNNGLIWAATKAGLNYFDYATRKFKFYESPEYPQLAYNHINSLCLSEPDKMWIAAREGLFLHHTKTGKTEQIGFEDKQIDYFITKIVADKAGNIWMLSNAGLLKYKPGEKSYILYDHASGLHANTEAIFYSPDGKLFIGGQKSGYYEFLPNEIIENKRIPPIFITDFSINNKSVPVNTEQTPSPLNESILYTKKLILNHKQTFFNFEFAALNFTHSENNKFQYIMEGFDEHWIPVTSNRRYATYTNLNPGKYKFRVKGSNNDGVWNNEGTSVEIIIMPPIWRSTWAYVVYVILAVGFTMYSIVTYTQRLHQKNTIKLEKLKTEKEIELNQLKLRFFTNISHEFRTPLSLISGPIEKLMSMSKTDQSEQHTYYTLIQRNVNRLRELTDQILDLRKIENNKLKLELSKGDLVGYVSHLVENFRTFAESLQITLIYSTSMKRGDTWFDPDKLEKIVDNLLSNAFKYTPQNGQVSVQVSQITTTDGEFARIAVTDTGNGISHDQLPYVFERFYQVENSASRNMRGTGIGLALAREMVLLHSGNIEAESDGKNGSTFWFTIPLQLETMTNYTLKEGEVLMERSEKQPLTAVHHPVEKPMQPTDNEARHRILVVEDNVDLRIFIKSIIQENYQVFEAENGIQGLEAARELQPDLIVSDIMMPEMDGNTMVRALKNDLNTSHIPIILLTALSSTDSKMIGFETGADDYITKPFNHELLLVRVKNLISNRKLLQDYFTRFLNVESRLVNISPTDIEIEGIDERFLKNMVAIVEKNLSNAEFSIEDLAGELNMVSRVLNRKFKALLNRTPGDFIFEMKMKRARQILLQNKIPIVEIADLVGFNDRKYFSICFKKFYGMSPSEYLKNQSINA
jgi:signal transduction histidine kinase/ligand-binding sensor domain-containing protein/DNA-binding response OmpR family regulator